MTALNAVNLGAVWLERIRAGLLGLRAGHVAHATNGARTGCYQPVEMERGEVCRLDAVEPRGASWCRDCFPADCRVCERPSMRGLDCPACEVADTVTEKRRAA